MRVALTASVVPNAFQEARGTFRYTIDCHGILDGAAAELFRLLAMDSRSFEAFWASVDAWQAPAPAPGASHCRHGMRAEFEERWANLVLSVLALLRAKMRTPTACVAALKGAVRAPVFPVMIEKSGRFLSYFLRLAWR